MFLNKKIKQLKSIIDDSKELITVVDSNNAMTLIENNECLLALELICEQLYEYDRKITPELYNRIKPLAEYYELDNNILELVRPKTIKLE